jgi:hypothetical protein
MRRLVLLAVPSLLLSTASSAAPTASVIANFGPSLVTDCPEPEGIAVDPVGNLYAASFAPAEAAPICVLSKDGQIIDHIMVPHGSALRRPRVRRARLPGEPRLQGSGSLLDEPLPPRRRRELEALAAARALAGGAAEAVGDLRVDVVGGVTPLPS